MMMLSSSTGDQLRHLSCQIQILQQCQVLLTTRATLADVNDLLAGVKANYGAESLLEDVIQRLVARHLALQIQSREAACRPVILSRGSRPSREPANG